MSDEKWVYEAWTRTRTPDTTQADTSTLLII